jgi:tetratricopeptide (TPR) repeat protein
MGGLAIQLGYFKPGDPRTVVGQIRSAAVASIPADKDYRYQVRLKDGRGIVFADAKTQLKYRVNAHEYDAASVYLDRGNFEEAAKLLRNVLLRTPDEFLALDALGTILIFQGRYQEAESTYHRSLEWRHPHPFIALFGLGATAELGGRYQEAIREFSLAIQDNPTFALSYAWRGRAYFGIGQFAQAKADLERVVELAPPEAPMAVEARGNLAIIKRFLPAHDSRGSAGVN